MILLGHRMNAQDEIYREIRAHKDYYDNHDHIHQKSHDHICHKNLGRDDNQSIPIRVHMIREQEFKKK